MAEYWENNNSSLAGYKEPVPTIDQVYARFDQLEAERKAAKTAPPAGRSAPTPAPQLRREVRRRQIVAGPDAGKYQIEYSDGSTEIR